MKTLNVILIVLVCIIGIAFWKDMRQMSKQKRKGAKVKANNEGVK